jgi:hypothetical protein
MAIGLHQDASKAQRHFCGTIFGQAILSLGLISGDGYMLTFDVDKGSLQSLYKAAYR